MPFSPKEKALPSILIDVDDSQTTIEHGEVRFVPSVNTSKALPSIKVENTLSGEEMCRLHELWNEAGLSARAHRRRRQKLTPRRIPAPIIIPEPEDIPPALVSVDLSTTSTAPPITGMRRRWGFFSAKSFSEKQMVEKKSPRTLETLRAIAQGRLKKTLRYAKSTPNLGDRTALLNGGATSRPAAGVRAVPKDVSASSPRALAASESIHQLEGTDKDAIYFTIDPTWRKSQGSMRFEFITPIPDSPTPLGRPDSPLLHRHHSLDQLSFAAQQASDTMKLPIACASDEGLDPIDELHTYLEL